jgi:hypothetical protein
MRAIRPTVSLCSDRAALANDTHRMLYEWMVPHLDRDGRITADPRVFRAQVCPMLEHVSALDCAAAIKDFVERDLATVYTDPLCSRVLVVTNFKEQQAGAMRYEREPRSKFGDPPKDSSS